MTSTRVPRRRGAIGGLLGTGVLINYVDRINLSVAAPQLQHQFKLGPTQMGLLFSAFFSPTHCCRFQMACFLTASASSWSNAGALLMECRVNARRLYRWVRWNFRRADLAGRGGGARVFGQFEGHRLLVPAA
jgi:hypothetical protein